MTLNFEKEGMKSVHFFTTNLNYPIAMASYSDWDTIQINCLTSNFKEAGFTSETLCRWCINHNIQYRIVYPLNKKAILKHPYKYLKYLELKKKLNYSL